MDNDLSMERGNHAGEPGWFTSNAIHIGWKEWGPFWLPALPLAVIFAVALIFSGRWGTLPRPGHRVRGGNRSGRSDGVRST